MIKNRKQKIISFTPKPNPKKRKNLVRGFTCGAFDLTHAGHYLMFEEVKKKCDYLIVGLQTDPSIDRKNKNKPIQTVKERRIQLGACKYIDKIIMYKTEKDLVELLEKIKPDIRFLGSDWKGKNFTGKDLPIKIIFNNRNHNYSTSNLRKKILKTPILKNKEKKIFVSGCYDILHAGHIEFFDQAKKLGDYLIVCFAGDKSLKLHKNKKPSLPEKHKKKILESLKMVDEVVVGDYLGEIGLDFKKHFLKIKPDILAVTEDDKYREQKTKLCKKIGAKYIVLPKTLNFEKISTTEIIKNIKENSN